MYSWGIHLKPNASTICAIGPTPVNPIYNRVDSDTHNIGICFGHQIIARAMGGECVPNDGKWEIGITTVDLTPLGQSIFGASTLVCRLNRAPVGMSSITSCD